MGRNMRLSFISKDKNPFGLKGKGSKKERFSVGLDIGTETTKIIILKFLKEQIELCDYYLEATNLPLKGILNNIKPSYEKEPLNISCCGPQTVLRYINFPKMDKEELRQALKFEAQKHIPFSLTEMNLDGYILKDDLPENKMLVLIAAVKKEFINQRIKLIEEAGFKINIVDIDSIALVNAFNFNYPPDNAPSQKAVALLNIGSSVSSLDILERGIPYLSRDIHIAGSNFTQRITDVLSVDLKAAEELKVNLGKEDEMSKKTQVALEPVLSNLNDEIRVSFDYYENQGSSTVSKIFLSGAGSSLWGLKDALANSLSIEVEYWDTLRKINLSKNIDSQKIKTVASKLAVAVGLALRE